MAEFERMTQGRRCPKTGIKLLGTAKIRKF
jgi:hypothetical protein